MLNKYNW